MKEKKIWCSRRFCGLVYRGEILSSAVVGEKESLVSSTQCEHCPRRLRSRPQGRFIVYSAIIMKGWQHMFGMRIHIWWMYSIYNDVYMLKSARLFIFHKRQSNAVIKSRERRLPPPLKNTSTQHSFEKHFRRLVSRVIIHAVLKGFLQ